MDEETVKMLDYQHKVMGNVAAGLLVSSWRLYGKLTEGQRDALARIKRDVEARRIKAERIAGEVDKVAKAERGLAVMRERLERLEQARVRNAVRKGTENGA